MSKQVYELDINGLKIKAEYYQDDVDNIFIPLLETLTELQKKQQRRIFVFMAAPPGSGKSTLALFLQQLSKHEQKISEIQVVGIDGFHYSNNYLKSHYMDDEGYKVLMVDRKGCAESFNTKALLDKLTVTQRQKNVRWPSYSREIHDVVEDSILVNKEIVLIEGNYLLLAEEEWQKLQLFCDYSIFISADNKTLKKRLIARKIAGGLSKKEATSFYINSDYRNIVRVNQFRKADLMLTIDKNNHFIKIKE